MPEKSTTIRKSLALSMLSLLARKTFLSILAALVLVLLVASMVTKRLGTEVTVQVVRTSAIKEYIDEYGRTRLQQGHLLVMPFDGMLEKAPPQEGESVRIGERIGRVDTHGLEEAIDDARAMINRSQLLNDDLRGQALSLTMDGTAEDDLTRFVGIFESMLSNSLRNLGSLHAGVGKFADSSNVHRMIHRMEVQLGEAELKSPIHGTVIRRFVDSRRFLPAGSPIVEIGDLEQLEFAVDVRSQDVRRLEVGDDAEVFGESVDRKQGEGFRGSVHRISPSGFTKISALGISEQRVTVVIRLDGKEARTLRRLNLGVDYEVRIRIYTEHRSDTVVVPRSALIHHRDGWEVFVSNGSRALRKPVTIGLINNEWAEVWGINAGESVILHPPSSLFDGQRILYRDVVR